MGPRTKAAWRKKEAAKEEMPHTIEMKEIHGEMVPVKVYKPQWAKDKSTNTTHFHYGSDMSELGERNKISVNRFNRKRTQAQRSKLEQANAMSMSRFSGQGKKSKKSSDTQGPETKA
jgi:hypothetical protein